MIKVVINADDFAYSKVFNAKILDLLWRDAIKSTTVLINRVDESQRYQVSDLTSLHSKSNIGIGVEYELLSEESALEEIDSQYKRFLNVFGFYPSHFNMHLPKVLRDRPDCAEVTKRLAHEILKFAKLTNKPFNNDDEYGIENWNGVKTTSRPLFVGTYHTLDEIKDYFGQMVEGETYEIIFHPGEYDPANASSLNAERKNDYDNILKLQKWLSYQKNVEVASFLDL